MKHIIENAMGWIPSKYTALPRSSVEIESAIRDEKDQGLPNVRHQHWRTYTLVISLIANAMAIILLIVAVRGGEKDSKSHSKSS